MPPILYGTAWKKERTAALVEQALRAGFRGIDTACQPKHYDEPAVGRGIAAFLRDGACARGDLYLQTKFTSVDGQDPKRFPYDRAAPLSEQVSQSCQVSLENLGVDVLDGLVLHSPMPKLEQTLEVWRTFEELVSRGWVRTLGLSNCYSLPTLRAVYEAAHVKPAILQNRFYKDTGYDVNLRLYCKENGIRYQSFWTLTANPGVLSSPITKEVAQAYGLTPAQAFLRCLIQVGITPLVGTTSAVHMQQDLAIVHTEIDTAAVDRVLATLSAP